MSKVGIFVFKDQTIKTSRIDSRIGAWPGIGTFALDRNYIKAQTCEERVIVGRITKADKDILDERCLTRSHFVHLVYDLLVVLVHANPQPSYLI